jgi:hypothetical protein
MVRNASAWLTTPSSSRVLSSSLSVDRSLEIQSQRLVQRLPMLAGKGLEIMGAAAAAQDPQHRHQRQEHCR